MEEWSLPNCRRLWQIVSGNAKNVTLIEIHETVFSHEYDIIRGILLFDNSVVSKAIEDEKQWPEDFGHFITRLANYLIVPRHQAWMILKSYILNDFCGSLTTIQKLKYEMQLLPLLFNVWNFFASERMYLLKVLKTIIEYVVDLEHPYATVFNEFAQHVGLRNLWNNLFEQFTYLIREVNKNIYDKNKSLLPLWVNRNVRELNEIVHCLIIFSNFVDVTVEDFHDILVMCKMHGFGCEPVLFKTVTIVDEKSLTKVKLSEVALLLCIANELWTQSDKSWFESSQIVNADLAPLVYREEHGAICFIWIIMHMVLENKVELFDQYLQKLMVRAIQLNCFQFFTEIISHEMFEDTKCLVGATVQEALYNLFSISCKNFDDDGQMLSYPGVTSCLHVLLKNQHLATKFFKEFRDENGDHIAIWSTAVELFPYDFRSLPSLSESVILTNTSASKYVLNELKNLPWYTEEYVPDIINHTLRRHNSESVLLLQPFEARSTTNLLVPRDTEIVIREWMNTTVAHFRHYYSFWDRLLFEIKRRDILSDKFEEHLSKIEMGLKVIVALLKVERDAVQSHPVLLEIVAESFNLLDLTCSLECPSFHLTTVCLDISTELLHNHRQFVMLQIESLDLLPKLIRNDIKAEAIFHENVLSLGKIGNFIVRTERQTEEFCSVLLSYLNFLRTSVMINKDNLRVIDIPGLIFVLKEVFPHFMIWFSKRVNVYQDVLYHCVHLVFEIFQWSTDENLFDDIILMRKLAYCSFLNESCGFALLRILSIGNSGILNIMEDESNWKTGRGVKFISTIKKVMAILMRLLTLRNDVIGNEGMTPLENFLYTENGGVKTMQAVASFINHPFNDSIPHLACRLLKKFAIELQMPMLAALNLEPDQIRLMFTQRLRDRYECDKLKLAIIELISASVPKQPGMTEAFFKLADSTQTFHNSGDAFNEGIGSFLVEYLIAFSSDVSDLNNTLLSRILELLHVLWMYQKEILIADLIRDELFWPSLCCPLFREVCFSEKTYSEIFNIIAKEIHKKSGKIDSTLMAILQKIFAIDQPYLNHWLRFIFYSNEDEDMFVDQEEYPLSTDLVVSWKDLMIIAVRFLPDTFFSTATKIKIVQEIRKALKKQIFSLTDNSTMTFQAEIYLFLIANWGDICFKEDEDCNLVLAEMIQKVSISYLDLSQRFRESMFVAAVLSIRCTKQFLTLNFSVVNSLIESFGTMFNLEYDSFMYKFGINQIDNSSYDLKEHKLFLLCFEAMNELMTIQNNCRDLEGSSWFSNSQYIRKLILCVKNFSERLSTLPLTKVALESLINYADSINVSDFLNSDIAVELWETLLPSVEYRQIIMFDIKSKPIPQYIEEWWIIYKRVFLLLTILLKRLGHLFLKNILLFISLHDENVQNILELHKTTLNMSALDLISFALLFLYELFKYHNYWRLDHEQSFFSMIATVKICINCISVIVVRPNVMRYFTLNVREDFGEPFENESIPADLQLQIMEKLTDIVTLAINCLSQFSPPLYVMLRNNTDYSNWDSLVENNFNIPTFSYDDLVDITFGSLICTASLYVRVLQQISAEKKMVQLYSPREILVPRKSKLSQQTSITKPDEEKQKEKKLDESEFRTPLKIAQIVSSTMKLDYVNPAYSISVTENFSAYGTFVKTCPWFSKLDKGKAYRALETIVTFLGSQASLITYYTNVEERQQRLIQRELCSEMQSFHEFIRKQVMDTYHISPVDRNNILLVRKKSEISIDNNDSEMNLETQTDVNLHKSWKTRFDLFHLASTNASRRTVKQLDNENNKLLYLSAFDENEQPTAKIKLISDDYLQFLSVWFMCVLHNNFIKM